MKFSVRKDFEKFTQIFRYKTFYLEETCTGLKAKLDELTRIRSWNNFFEYFAIIEGLWCFVKIILQSFQGEIEPVKIFALKSTQQGLL